MQSNQYNSNSRLSGSPHSSNSGSSHIRRRTNFAMNGQQMINGFNSKIDSIINIPVVNASGSKGLIDERELECDELFKVRQNQGDWDEHIDNLTQDSTPSKDQIQCNMIPLLTKVNQSEESPQFSNSFASDEIAPFESDEKYEIVQNIKVGAKISKTQKKTKMKTSFEYKEEDEPVCSFESLFSNSLILKNQTSSSKQFKSSQVYVIMKELQATFNDLVVKPSESDEENDKQRFDFDSEQGQANCRSILKLVEKLFNAYKLNKNNRDYRQKFSKAYKILYSQNSGQEELSYLTEILDSAQENYPHLWVNGEKYVFSEDVINAGDSLNDLFLGLKVKLNDFSGSLENENLNLKEKEMKECLLQFDQAWTTYEQYYVYELMVIESDARRFIIEAIQVESQISEMEANPENITMDQYNEKRQELVQKLAQINTISNVQGKGRDDLTDIEILTSAEAIPKMLSQGQAQSIQILADKIRQSFSCFRILLNKYQGNLDAVDPQLRNNSELTQIIEVYENSWSLGKDQLLDKSKRNQIIHFCLNIERLSRQYSEFKEQVESCEADIFLSIPSLMVLRSIQNVGDSSKHKELCKRFHDTIDFDSLQSGFNALQGDREEASKNLENFILFDDKAKVEDEQILKLGQKIKSVGMELSRSNAQEFNQFITASLNGE